VTILRDNNCQSCLLLFGESFNGDKCTLIDYCVDGSIGHFKFPKIVQAGEVGTLTTVLLRVSSVIILPKFIEIGSYLTFDRQGAKNKLAQFF